MLGLRRGGCPGGVRIEDEVLVTGVRSARHFTVTPDPRPGGHGAAGGVAGAARTAPEGRTDDVRDRPTRRLPQDHGGAGAPRRRAVLCHQRLREESRAAEIAELLVQTDPQLRELRPGGQLTAPLRRQREVITAGERGKTIS